jgi:hypothetical protein
MYLDRSMANVPITVGEVNELHGALKYSDAYMSSTGPARAALQRLRKMSRAELAQEMLRLNKERTQIKEMHP